MKIKTASLTFILGLFFLGSVIVWASSISLSRTSQIQEIWLEFEEHRNDRQRALISLRSELGYSGMIHRFKNYILRQNEYDSRTLTASIGGALAAIHQYKSLELNATEEQAIVKIENTLEAYRSALNQTKELIQQQKTAKQIDHIVKVDDSFALEALSLLENETHTAELKRYSRPLLLNSLRSSMGYGGLIHNFKNYILRHSPEEKARTIKEIDNIDELAKRYRSHELSLVEEKALTDILVVVASYRKNLPIIQQMSAEGKSPRAIDRAVFIDDSPAVDGFNILQREITINNEFRAKQLNKALRIVQKTGNIIFYITLVSFIFFIVSAIWMMNCLIVHPISKLTNTMSRLSNNDLSVKILGTELKSEIGEMARAVEVFKINAIEKQQAEGALQTFNEHLEETVQQRTKTLEENEVRLAAMAKHASEGEERLETLIDTAMDAVVQINEQGIVINWNKQAEIIFGWPLNEALGQKLHHLIIPEQYREQHIKGIKRYLATKKMTVLGKRIEITAKHRDGHKFPIELAISPIKYKGHYQFSAFIRDISEQKESQSKIIKAKDEAEAANQSKSEFLANMSHELRTPMHGILSFANIGIKKSSSPEHEKLHQYFSNIKLSGDRLLVLLDDLLDLSKIEAGMMKLNRQENDLAEIFLNCFKEQEQRMNDLSLKLQLIKPNELLKGSFDVARIKQVIANLLSNAIKFSPENSSLIASLSKNDNNELCFSLQDKGIGIPENELETIFNAFIQSSKTKTGAGGTGLGLAICKEIIESHGGKIWAENNPQQLVLYSHLLFQMFYSPLILQSISNLILITHELYPAYFIK